MKGLVPACLALAVLAACAGPQPKVSLYDQGMRLERQGRQDEALAALRDAVNLDRGDPVPREALAALFYRRGWLASATQAWERALKEGASRGGAPAEEARQRATAGLLKIYLSRGAAAARNGLWADASADYLRATELAPDDAEAWPGLAVAAGRLGDKNTAYLAYRRCFSLDPGSPDLAWGYGYAAHALLKLDDALQAYRRYTALDPRDARGWNNEGAVLVELGRFDESLACFDKALGLDPQLITALNGKGSACYYLKRFEEARGLWARVLDLAPDDPTATNNVSTLVKMGF